MTTPTPTLWTGRHKLHVVLAAQGLSETELGALLRCEGCMPPSWTSGGRRGGA